MSDKFKVYLFFVFLLVCCLCIWFVSRCFFNGKSNADNQAGTDRNEVISEHSETIIGNVKQELSGAYDQVQFAGNQITESLDGVGNIRASADTIEEANRTIRIATERIEDGICRIEGILHQAAEENKVLEDVSVGVDECNNSNGGS